MPLQIVALLVGGLVGLLGCPGARAVEAFGATPQEMALCTALVFGGKDKAYLERTYPNDHWGSTHHWCDCVRFRYRALKSIGNKSAFGHNLSEAIDGCNYVIRALPPTSRLLPKVHIDKGRALRLRGEVASAVQEFQRAISLNPSEIDAYLELSVLLDERGQRSVARDTIRAGMQHNPDSKLLRERYVDLGGKEPFPENDLSVAPVPSKPGTAEGPTPDEDIKAGLSQSAATTESSLDSVPVEDPSNAQGGGQRSCRFCPPEEVQRRWIDSFETGR